MAKQLKIENLIDVEITKFENKVKEFQDYLKTNNIVTQVMRDNSIVMTEDDQDKLHKEILVQIKIQDALLQWMSLLKKLRETEKEKKAETRGDIQVGEHFQ